MSQNKLLFEEGQRVKHFFFGKGTFLCFIEKGGEERVVVRFDRRGIKHFLIDVIWEGKLISIHKRFSKEILKIKEDYYVERQREREGQ